MRKDKSSRWVSWAELITPGRAVLIALVLVSPAIVVFYASLVHSWYFSEPATPKAATLSWRLNSEPQLCETLATSGMWVTLKCRQQTTVAPIAGFELPSDEKDKKNLQPALDQLWGLTRGRNAAKVACELVSVSTTDGSLPSLPFARCRIGGRSVTELLASLGAPLAPEGSPARSTLDEPYQKYAGNQPSTAASAKPDPAKEIHRSTALALQGWVATLLGFVGAAIGVIYSGHERAARARNRRRLLRERVRNSRNLLQDSSATLKGAPDASWDTATSILSNLRENLRAFLESQGHDIPDYINGNLNIIENALKTKQLPDRESLNSIYQYLLKVSN